MVCMHGDKQSVRVPPDVGANTAIAPTEPAPMLDSSQLFGTLSRNCGRL